ncbi:hypothetical protein [Naumannella halotolerans]|uniref:Uncharacterized protein n=1 Tax=Naumannella halotolerans TaxID=993414 RepID=A0A4R7J405_9ACTN|nr:hypothetical protein [Naumannella halotolerans]TDT31089.1 hypothetical protein CLV29_2502 [Naumannella halotolerans]
MSITSSVDKKKTNQTNFWNLVGDTLAIWKTIRFGVKGKFSDGPLVKLLKQINAKLDVVYKEVRPGVAGKYSDGPLARLIRSSRNDVRNDIAALSKKLDELNNKIGA